jgi:hypothetical protein
MNKPIMYHSIIVPKDKSGPDIETSAIAESTRERKSIEVK